jgi:hypothetical protein
MGTTTRTGHQRVYLLLDQAIDCSCSAATRPMPIVPAIKMRSGTMPAYSKEHSDHGTKHDQRHNTWFGQLQVLLQAMGG